MKAEEEASEEEEMAGAARMVISSLANTLQVWRTCGPTDRSVLAGTRWSSAGCGCDTRPDGVAKCGSPGILKLVQVLVRRWLGDKPSALRVGSNSDG